MTLDMRRLYPDVAFDWKKITQRLAEKREACRRYRSRRRSPETASHSRSSELFYGVYEPGTRTIYINGVPSTAGGVGALLDAILQRDRGLQDAPPPSEPGDHRITGVLADGKVSTINLVRFGPRVTRPPHRRSLSTIAGNNLMVSRSREQQETMIRYTGRREPDRAQHPLIAFAAVQVQAAESRR